MADKTYNGHRNWTYWNVALWIGNDEGLYRFALDCIREAGNRRAAAEAFISGLRDFAPPSARGYEVIPKTPDGARYSVGNVMAALRGLSC